MATDSYSRMVAWLKILLPLAALGLLSTLFLLSRVIDPTASIPFADTEVRDRVRDQQITGPFFSAITADGDQIAFLAERLTTVPNQIGTNRAEDIRIRIDMTKGTQFTLASQTAQVDISSDKADLQGDVVMTTSTGYLITTQALNARMSRLEVRSPGRVEATSPFGTLQAGQMLLTQTLPDTGPQLLFTNGVKLLYQPKTVKE